MGGLQKLRVSWLVAIGHYTSILSDRHYFLYYKCSKFWKNCLLQFLVFVDKKDAMGNVGGGGGGGVKCNSYCFTSRYHTNIWITIKTEISVE